MKYSRGLSEFIRSCYTIFILSLCSIEACPLRYHIANILTVLGMFLLLHHTLELERIFDANVNS